MSFLFVAFKSKNAVSVTYEKLCEANITCAIISTPSAANVGCGMSIKFLEKDLDTVRSVVAASSIFGIFRATRVGLRIIATRI